MSKKQQDTRGKQQGAQAHAEGQHGEKTHARFLEEIQAEDSGDPARDRVEQPRHPRDGGHRLMTDRKQFDEAEMQSEKNRLSKDIDAHDHDRSEHQVVGGAASHPAMPDTQRDPLTADRTKKA